MSELYSVSPDGEKGIEHRAEGRRMQDARSRMQFTLAISNHDLESENLPVCDLNK